MQTLRLISFLLLLLAVTSQAQTNTTPINGTNMPMVTPGANDFVPFYKWSGVKYLWGRTYIPSFYAEFTNSAAGQVMWSNLTANAVSIAAGAASQTTSSNALQSQITANKATANTASNVVAVAVTNETFARQSANVALSNAVALKYDASNPTGYQTAAQVEKRASDWQKELMEFNRFESEKIFRWVGQCGSHLGKLAKSHPDRVSKRVLDGHALWTIKPPAKTTESK